jgi:hypothetical protein
MEYNNIIVIEKELKMLKFERVAKIGDYIRAYDFKPMRGRMDCYVEGEVVEITNSPGFKSYKIICKNDVFSGEMQEEEGVTRNGQEIFIPMQVSFMEYDSRIMNLSE